MVMCRSTKHDLAIVRHALVLGTIAIVSVANPVLYAGDHSRFTSGPRYDMVDGCMYLAIAAAPDAVRTFNRTVANVTAAFLIERNVTLDTLPVHLPDNGSFSGALLERLCRQFEGRHVVAALVIGDGPAALTVSLAAQFAGVPVLWARAEYQGGILTSPGMGNSPLEIHLTPPSLPSLLLSLRHLLIHTHWHTFTLLAADHTAAGALQRPELWLILSTAPLHPTLITISHPQKAQVVFRKLADISRLTRGIIILLSDKPTAVKILDDGRRLNMLDGEFIWIWVDTRRHNVSSESSPKKHDASVESSSATDIPPSSQSPNTKAQQTRRSRRSVRDELAEMQINYLLKNDQFLLFNHRNNEIRSKYDQFPPTWKDSTVDYQYNTQVGRTGRSVVNASVAGSFLPTGLLAVRPVPLKVDRHLVKAAVRLLVATLGVVLTSSPRQDGSYNYSSRPSTIGTRVDTGRISSSCWRPLSEPASNFSTFFARELKALCADAVAGKNITQENGVDKLDKSLVANFEILNLVPEQQHTSKDVDNNNTLHYKTEKETSSSTFTPPTMPERSLRWKRVGMVSGRQVRLDTIVWPGGDLSVSAASSRARSVFRIVTALAPPFVMESDLDEDGQCLRGLPCHRVLTSDKDNLTLVFNEMEHKHRMEEELEEEQTDQISKSSSAHRQYLTQLRDEKHKDFLNPVRNLHKYKTHCCYGLSMDLLENIAQELEFDFRLYIVADALFGTRTTVKPPETNRSRRALGKTFISYRFSRDNYNMDRNDPLFVRDTNQADEEIDASVKYKWNGIVGDLISGAAHMSFAPLSVSSARSSAIDFSVPYFYSGVSFLAAPQQKSEIPLMAFLLPFSPELWIAIFTSLNITAIAVAIYEWLSPFGLNPWGRQRSKNFSMSSALWVMWGLLCGHLVAFKAPKSWPNKFLINVWGGFSVIFVASYTANIAALIAGLFFQNTVSNYHDRSLLSQKIGAPRASAAEYYVQKANRLLWEHMRKYSLDNVEDGIRRLRNGSLDILIADTPILDYYRATDHGCKLHKIGDTINEDTYAIGMNKGFPLKDSISAVIAKYSSNGYMDILQEKWYGGLPCFKLPIEIAQPRPLGVAAVTGVFILLGVGMFVGCLILFVEHVFFRYSLPALREKPKDSVWRSRNIMFFSQKLYRFINCVELVSPHHAARELVHTIRQGQITSLFQKSIKRKEHEQRRRRKSKAQFFEMIQEIRSTILRQQQEERTEPQLESVAEDEENQLSPEDKRSKIFFLRSSPKSDNSGGKKSPRSPSVGRILFSPRSTKDKSPTNLLNVRRFSTDSVFNEPQQQPITSTLKIVDRSAAVGRRLSKDATSFLSTSPPDINSRRSSYLDIITSSGRLSSGKSPVLSIENVSDVGLPSGHERKLSDSESIGRKLATLPKRTEPVEKSKLAPQFSLQLGKSDEALAGGRTNAEMKTSASAENLKEIQKPPKAMKPPIPHKKFLVKSKTATNNPHIRIEVEDTSLGSRGAGSFRVRHQSLTEPPTANLLDAEESARKVRQHSLVETTLPTATDEQQTTVELPSAPPPNCSPRITKSPLERLSRDELVVLWQSSESELRSHLLKAIRQKEHADVTDKPP